MNDEFGVWLHLGLLVINLIFGVMLLPDSNPYIIAFSFAVSGFVIGIIFEKW